ncbi:DNA adenine methylase [Kaistia dalseonensis]|uniref:DNA adenine methylase n=1 Tax=Kaistia dalseonensis TaxID=410840 RepID=UPI002253F307|nr:DNA adenine methylase [Kaistia dalseonensis]MCX5495111.1 DNA adenine methylase [Kaistia dalseonensis]
METSEFRTVEATRPLAGYIGGKRNLAGRLVERIDRVHHLTYCEPFVGMGGVFLRRTRAPRSEVINDRSGDVIGFFRILQRHYVAFLDFLRFQLTSRREFERLSLTDPTTLTDIERAARFLYLQRTAFGGKVVGRSFGVSPDRPGRFDVTTLAPMLEAVHERLSGVVIECLPYADVIRRYDRPETLFYLDPPYAGSEGDYGAGAFVSADFALLADQLRSIAGRFILSINDTPMVRGVFKGFQMDAVSTTYSVSAKSPTRASELIISGP